MSGAFIFITVLPSLVSVIFSLRVVTSTYRIPTILLTIK